MKKIFVKFAVVAVLVAPLTAALPARAATPNWTLNAPRGIDFSCGGTYSHTLDTVSQDVSGNLIARYCKKIAAGIVSINGTASTIEVKRSAKQ